MSEKGGVQSEQRLYVVFLSSPAVHVFIEDVVTREKVPIHNLTPRPDSHNWAEVVKR